MRAIEMPPFPRLDPTRVLRKLSWRYDLWRRELRRTGVASMIRDGVRVLPRDATILSHLSDRCAEPVRSRFIHGGWPRVSDVSLAAKSVYVYFRAPTILGLALPDKSNAFVAENLARYPSAKVYMGPADPWSEIDWKLLAHGDDPPIPYIRKGHRMALGWYTQGTERAHWNLFTHMAASCGASVLPLREPCWYKPLRVTLTDRPSQRLFSNIEAAVAEGGSFAQLTINSATSFHVISRWNHTEINYPGDQSAGPETWEIRARGPGALKLLMGASLLLGAMHLVRPISAMRVFT